ncbi:TRAP transporter fused permease subunit [Enterocloster citroniae]|jgi:TRAP transporter 4TM/12TM fusion protein|uniref:TRAP transporter fused permease subunit n=4 Tax=Enterocloster citroniae TaxID=358743 RepID=A0AA41FHU5_9FIRM|nr:TRAP transporter fused permease subunit [Enterocloster citroniae]MCC3382750.1 TRAP transporter permease [Enterocloster citroniae]RGC11472.1 TRAP transporter permease [Enterocloster citroniae]
MVKGDIMADAGNKTLGQDTVSLSSVETVDADTQQELLDKYDRDSAVEKESKDWRYKVSDIMGGILCLYVYITCAVGAPEALMHRAIFMCFCLTMIFLLYALRKQDTGRLPRWYDFIMIATVLVVCGYVISNHRSITTGSGIASKLEIFLCILLVLTVMEAIRRSGGTSIVIIIAIFLAYAYFGKYAPGALKHSGLSIKRIASQLLLTSEGLFGSNVGTVAGVLSLFLIFATFMEKTGTGQFINDFALSIAGKSAGGPAKVSVVTSALFGTISGNAVSNVVTTGAFTIPLMKKTGYEPEFAGAVEAVSSTAGQLMPPIMGASAFIMADITGIAYSKICLAAIVPVLLYYTGCFAMVHLRACKLGLRGLAKEDCPKLLLVLKEDGYLFLPFIFVVVMLCVGYTVTWVGVRAIPLCVLIAACKKKTRLGLKDIWQCLQLSGKRLVSVAAMCCGINMITAVCNLTGITQTLSNVILKLAGGNFTISCILIAVICIVMGMGLPTISVYMLLSTVAAPALISGFNVPVLAAHMFVFYFGLLANVTPPVAIPAYAAAGLANADPGKTGWQAFKLALGGFLVPMIFINSPDLLFCDGLVTIWVIEKIVTAVIGVMLLSTAVEGWMLTKMQRWQRAVVAVAAILMVIPTTLTDVIGVTVMVVTGLSQNRLLIRQKQG